MKDEVKVVEQSEETSSALTLANVDDLNKESL